MNGRRPARQGTEPGLQLAPYRFYLMDFLKFPRTAVITLLSHRSHSGKLMAVTGYCEKKQEKTI